MTTMTTPHEARTDIPAFHLHVGIDLDDIAAAQQAVTALTEGKYALQFGVNVHDGSHDSWIAWGERLGTVADGERVSHGLVCLDVDVAAIDEVSERIVQALRPWLQPIPHDEIPLLAQLTAGANWEEEFTDWT